MFRSINETIRELEEEMVAAANNLEFEKAALLRDQVRELKRTLEGKAPETAGKSASRFSYSKGRAKGRAGGKGRLTIDH